jgi:hypothetical protein
MEYDGELTSCNHCNLERIKLDAEKKMRVSLIPSIGDGWI